MDKKLLTGIIVNVLVILFVLGVFLSPSTTTVESSVDNTIDNNNATDDTNIKLIKAETSGYVFVNNGSDPYYNYYLDGVLLNLPSDIEGYDLKTIFYGENNEFLHEDDGYLEWMVDSFAKSEQDLLGSWQTQDPKNVSKIEVIIIDPMGEIIFNETVKYDMDKFDYSRLHHS